MKLKYVFLSALFIVFIQLNTSYGQSKLDKSVFVGFGISAINTSFIDYSNSMYFSNIFGLTLDKYYTENFGVSSGISFVQNRYKYNFAISTKAYLTIPVQAILKFGLGNGALILKTGIGVDFYSYHFINADENIYNEFYPYLLNFTIPSRSLRYFEVLSIPISLQYMMSVETQFNIKEDKKFGVALNFKYMEIVSLYGPSALGGNTNYAMHDNPIHLSLSLSYYFGGKAKGEE